jgi:LSD1 subclass zinc finger protein
MWLAAEMVDQLGSDDQQSGDFAHRFLNLRDRLARETGVYPAALEIASQDPIMETEIQPYGVTQSSMETRARRKRRALRESRVYLLETWAAGFQYHDGPEPEVQTVLADGNDLLLVREPYNEYDAQAIAIHTHCEDKVGFIPRQINTMLATMMDQGIPLFAEIVVFRHDLVEETPWNCLRVRVYMPAPRVNRTHLFTLNCPCCSAPLQADKGSFRVRCAYCGSEHVFL